MAPCHAAIDMKRYVADSNNVFSHVLIVYIELEMLLQTFFSEEETIIIVSDCTLFKDMLIR